MYGNAQRHAYLIVAHDQFELLKKLLALLDDPRNDIFLHIDRKSDVDTDAFFACVRKSKLTLVPRLRVAWGGYSLVRCEMRLLRAAAEGGYRYCHLLSGVDLPLRTQDEIHAFFAENDGREFLSVDTREHIPAVIRKRIAQYHPLQQWLGRPGSAKVRGLGRLNRWLLAAQRRLRVDRLRALPMQPCKGANWFSITDGLARHLLARRAFIRRHFRMTMCSDEIFAQTLAMDSPFRANVTNDLRRYMVWDRTSPRVLTLEDYDAMRASGCLWARKFDERVDRDVVDRLFRELRG